VVSVVLVLHVYLMYILDDVDVMLFEQLMEIGVCNCVVVVAVDDNALDDGVVDNSIVVVVAAVVGLIDDVD
jgi:hypothetical protein